MYKLFLSYFLHLSPVNLSLLASLIERSTHGKFSCFFGVGDEDDLEEDDLANGATKNIFVLFWEAAESPAVKAFPCF